MSGENVWSAGEPESAEFARYRLILEAASDDAYQPARDVDVAPRQPARPAKSRRRAKSAKETVTAEAVLRSFNTWAFKREQPADPQSMLRTISASIALEEPVSFILYWGKGPRCRIAAPDIECLDYLAALAQRVREAYEPGAAIRLIFTDTHAELNGHAPLGVRRYFAEIEACAGERSFEICFLSQLTRTAETVATRVKNDEPVPEETLQLLSASARKWYRGDGTAGQGALKYFQMNMIEKRAVELAFPRSIFITFNGSDLRSLFPDCLPIFYMYSLRRGVSVKPWFIPALEATSSENIDPS
jgi:hypothetical protein